MSSSNSGSGMYYHGTEIEVQLGDRVLIKPLFFGWFRKPSQGTVCYIPGISPTHKHLDYEGYSQWAIRLDCGVILAAGYDPSNPYGQPNKRIKFIGRGEGGELKPDELVDETWEEAKNQPLDG